MINLRIYRATLVLVPIAIVVAMFSLQSDPAGRHSPTAPEGFDGAAAAALARSLDKQAPRPRPGSEADKKRADLVAASFDQIQGAQVSKQEFSGSFEGNDVELTNVICVLPGESNEQIVMIAGRDAARGEGAAGAAASTAALMQIASGFGGSTHRKTLVFVSTDASTVGAQGARRFVSGYGDIGEVSAALVLSTPAAQTPSQPLVIPWSTGPQSTSIELERTAEVSVDDETSGRSSDESAFAELARLALPVNLGEQGPLIESGIDAVRISSMGERPPPPTADEETDISADTLGEFGRATLATLLALDAGEPLEHGPSAYVGLVGNLLPGWALALVSLSLIVPLILVALAADVRAARRPEALLAAGVWVLIRSLPLLLALLFTYLLGFAGLMPRPGFPYDPGRFPIGIAEIIGLVLIAAVLAGGLWVVKPWRKPPPSVGGGGAAAACATLIALGGLGVWLANPYLALLIVPALHAWVLLLAESTAVGSVLALGITLVGLLPLFAALAVIAGHLAVGRDVLWQFFLLLGDGQISPALALLGCLLAGCGLSALALARSRIDPAPPARPPAPPQIKVRGPERPYGAT